MKIITVYFFLFGVLLVTSCDSCYFGSSESVQPSEWVSFSFDLNGNPQGSHVLGKFPVNYRYFNDNASYTSDLSLIRQFDAYSIMNYIDFFGTSSISHLGNYIKTSFFQQEFETNWNTLTRNFNSPGFDFFETSSPYTSAWKIFQQHHRIDNPFISDSTYHSVYTPNLIRYSTENPNDTVKIFQSGFDSALSYQDTLVLDMKLEHENSLILLLNVTRYETTDDQEKSKKRYRRVSNSLVIYRFRTDSTHEIVYSQLNPGLFSDEIKLFVSTHYYLIEGSTGFVFVDKNSFSSEFKSRYVENLNAIPSKKGHLIVYQHEQYPIFYMRNTDGSLQKLSELLPVTDNVINFALLYDDRYLMYISDNFTRISQFDLKQQLQRFSIPIHSTYLRHIDSLIPTQLKPLILMNDHQFLVLIEFLLPSTDDDGC